MTNIGWDKEHPWLLFSQTFKIWHYFSFHFHNQVLLCDGLSHTVTMKHIEVEETTKHNMFNMNVLTVAFWDC